MQNNTHTEQEQAAPKLPVEKNSRPKRHGEQNSSSSLDIRRFFMPNIDKIVKNVMHEISEGKASIRESMVTALHNQEIIIAQNKQIIVLLETLKDHPAEEHPRTEILVKELAADYAESDTIEVK